MASDRWHGASGRLGGEGIIGGEVNVSGTLAPGANIGELTVGADTVPKNVTMAENSTYEWQLGPSTADKVTVIGDLALPAVWTLKLFDEGGTPSGPYDLFTYGELLTSYTAPTVDYGETGWTSDDVTINVASGHIYLMFGPAVVPGDTNADGVVDAADFITLKKNFGAGIDGGPAAGNFDETGTVNWADLNILTNNIGSGSGVPATAPEPCSAMLLVFGAAALLRRRRRA